MPWDELKLHPDNPRTGDVPAIVESIRTAGWFGECGEQASTGFLIWGNHRAQAGQQAVQLMARARSGEWTSEDADEVALIESWATWPERFGGELDACPVLSLDVDDEGALDIMLSDNATSDRAEYDDARRAALLTSIEERRGTLAGTGYSGPELRRLTIGGARA